MDHFIQFINAIEDDSRIGATHISIYMVLLYQFEHYQRNPFTIKREEIMFRAKIHARHTYNVCMNQLHEYGYIKYHPSSNPNEGSQVYLLIS
jgi:hypothetical protein